ncbi:nucleolin-like [Scylla paramamosain]|uniref:nucleolin-like n=1 Tax=Scylla paramamosain TaxID=85552 RepID=UPI003083ACC1
MKGPAICIRKRFVTSTSPSCAIMSFLLRAAPHVLKPLSHTISFSLVPGGSLATSAPKRLLQVSRRLCDRMTMKDVSFLRTVLVASLVMVVVVMVVPGDASPVPKRPTAAKGAQRDVMSPERGGEGNDCENCEDFDNGNGEDEESEDDAGYVEDSEDEYGEYDYEHDPEHEDDYEDYDYGSYSDEYEDYNEEDVD